MKPKYYQKDVLKMVDVFCNLNEKEDISKVTFEDIKDLLDYPVPVIQEFLKAVEAIDPKTVEEHTDAAILYILLRINLVEVTDENNG